jgi:uncharacterized phiE125 gp8 family phage protein
MGLKLITPSAVDAITLTEAKDHLSVVDSDDDTYITALVKSACANAEAWMGRALIDQTWDLYLDSFPPGLNSGFGSSQHLEILIPKPPLIEVISIAYDQPDGTEATVDGGNYYVDNVTEPGWVVPAGTLTWPTPIAAINSVRVRFRAGYLDTSSPPQNAVPFDIKAGILLSVGSMFENREQVVVGTIASKLPWGAENLLRPHRVLLGMA